MGTVYRHNPHHPLHPPTLQQVIASPPVIDKSNPAHHPDEDEVIVVLHIFRNDPYNFQNGGKCYLNPHSSHPTNGAAVTPQDGEATLVGPLRPEEEAFVELEEKNYYDDLATMNHHHRHFPEYHQDSVALGHRSTPPPPHAGLLLPAYEQEHRLIDNPRDVCPMEQEEEGADELSTVDHELNFHASDLAGKVTYVPYPTEEFYCPPPLVPREEMTRLFIGQLPYDVTDMQLQWLCYTFGNRTIVHFPERILKKREHHHGAPPQYGGGGPLVNDRDRSTPAAGGGAPRVSTGCVHAYCHPDDAAALMEGLHKRVLVDEAGVWYASPPTSKTVEDEEECEAELHHLKAYVSSMKSNKNLRPINRPFDTVVVQTAISTYVPRPPSYNSTKKMTKEAKGLY